MTFEHDRGQTWLTVFRYLFNYMHVYILDESIEKCSDISRPLLRISTKNEGTERINKRLKKTVTETRKYAGLRSVSRAEDQSRNRNSGSSARDSTSLEQGWVVLFGVKVC